MKIRKGFVSNSSSSSFIIKTSERFKDIGDVAKAMLKLRNEDWGEYEDDSKYHEPLEKIDPYRKLTDYKKNGIYFRTTNYDTFLYEIDGYIIVKTANNHRFYDIFDGEYVMTIPDEILKKLNEYGLEGYDDIEFKNPNIDFVNLEDDIIGKELEYVYLCPEHPYVSSWMIRNTKNEYICYCPRCKKEINIEGKEDTIYSINYGKEKFLIKGIKNLIKLNIEFPYIYHNEVKLLTIEEASNILKNTKYEED